MADNVLGLNIFSDEEIESSNNSESTENIDKMQSFGEVNESPTFIIDESALDNLNSQDLENIVEIIEPVSLEEKTINDVTFKQLHKKEAKNDTAIKSKTVPTEENISNKFTEPEKLEKQPQSTNSNEQTSLNATSSNKSEALLDMSAELSGKVDEIGTKTLSYGKKLLSLSLSLYQDKVLYNKFEKGDLVQAGDFSYLLYEDELMVYKYLGNKLDVVVPDYVGNLPVKYLYKGFLCKGFVDNHKVRGFLSYFKEDNILELSTDKLSKATKGIVSIQLPINLIHIPQNAFNGCYNLNNLVIPPSVKIISPRAFNASGIKNIYFQGSAPKNVEALKLSVDMNIYCLPQYIQSYNKFIREISKYIADYNFNLKEFQQIQEEVKLQTIQRESIL